MSAAHRLGALPLPALTPLPRAFYARPTIDVARDLLGKLLVRTGTTHRLARIVEVEAYLGERDQASHARRGPTPRAAIMFGLPGYLYVYLVYGMHNCMNVVTEQDGVAGAVLLRAAEPLDRKIVAAERPLSGPGKLCAGLGITRADNGLDLCDSDLIIAADPRGPAEIGPLRTKRSARIGVDYAGAWAGRLLRFYLAGNPYVSGKPRV